MTSPMHGVQRLVLLATGLGGEPRGAWFEPTHADGLVRAARQAGAHLVEVDAGRLRQLDPTLPAGQLLAPGRPSPLPPIRRATFDCLIALPDLIAVPRQVHDVAFGGPPVSSKLRPASLRTAKRTIKVGSVVLASVGLEDGWWEAEVVAIEGDGLLLRWRDFPGLDDFRKPPRIGGHATERRSSMMCQWNTKSLLGIAPVLGQQPYGAWS